MDSYVKRILGEEKVKEMCDEYELNIEDRKIVNTILEEW